ncbi:MAG: hypothetical protein NC331_00415 [Lachnospiraceae bacterium]|nr:hypothetical protein [Lachnospiraceae bacterium]MCM1237830.1 hypothetical protein [Lachnospiraceae bacterium]
MILSEVASYKLMISRTILNMEIPFKLSQLYEVLEQKGITDRELILDVHCGEQVSYEEGQH